MAHITTLTRAYNDLYNSQANTYSYSGSFETFKESEVKVKLNDTLLTYNSSPSDATQYSVNLTDKTIHVGGGNLSSGTLSIYPETDLGAPTLKAPYTAGSAITASDLTNNQKQTMRKLMEHEETKLDNTGGTMTGDLTMGEDRNIIFEGATDDAHETTITVADPTADRTITFPNVSGNVVTTGDTGTVTSTMITNDTIVNADVNSSAAIAGTKISPNFGGQNIVTTGSLTVGSTLAVTGAIDFNGGANIDNIQIGVTDDNEIDTASGNLTIDSAGGTVTIDDALAVTGGASLNSTLGVTGTSTLSNITGGAVVTSGTSTSDTKVYSAKRAGEIFYGKGTVEEIQSGETWSAADDKVATTAAIDARIIDLVDDVGGFVPIANELSFPNANPDVNNGAGTLVSIKGLSQNLTSNGSGQISISNGTVGNSTVTITGAANSTTYASGFGMIVETTTTLNTYTFHRLVPKATEVTAVVGNATNINTVATNITNVNTVGNNISNVNTVAGDTTEINALAAKTTELGLLGTAAVVEDLGILGTADVVSDLNTLGTADVVSDMNTLAVSDVISDMNTLAVSGVISDMDTVATNVTNVNNVGGSIASVNTAAANINSIANFGDQYQVSANNPSTDGGGNALAAGDLYFNTSANELKVYNGSAWQGGVTATGNFAVVTGNTFTGDNRYNDGVKALYGTGSDLQIYHSSNASYLANTNGNLFINNSSGEVQINKGTTEYMARFVVDGGVQLYYDNSKKLETNTSGIGVTGNITVSGNVDGRDLAADGTKLDTYEANGSSYLRSDAADIKTSGDLTFNDNIKSKFGTGGDLQIYHSGSHSFIDHTNGTGHLIINSSATNNVDIMRAGHGEYMARFKPDNAAELYYDNSKKFETTSIGGTLTGHFNVNDTSSDSASARIYLQSGNTADSSIYFGRANDSATAALRYEHTSNAFQLWGYNNSLRAEINSSGNFRIPNDSGKITFGTGDDLQIYHDGSNSYVAETGIGELRLTGDSNIRMMKTTAETLANFTPDANCELFYDNSKKFETTSSGNKATGKLGIDDGDGSSGNYLSFGNSDDMKIFHSGSHSMIKHFGTGNFYISCDNEAEIVLRPKLNEAGLVAKPNGAVELYYDNTKKFETGHGGEYGSFQALNGANGWDGMSVANNRYVFMGNESSEAVGIWNDHANEWMIKVIADGSVKLYYNGNETFQTQSDGAAIEGSNPFLRLNGSASTSGDTGIFLNANANHWLVKADNYSSGNQFQIRAGDTSSSELALSCAHNAAVKLNYDNSTKFETTSGGVQVTGGINVSGNVSFLDNNELKLGTGDDLKIKHDGTHNYVNFVNGALIFQNNGTSVAYFHDSDGHFIPWSNNTFDLGSSGNRWRNVYTNDLHLSNEGSSNDVDSTWGDWTIQEGESDLFLKNNRSGKKYKFNLTEVS